MSPGRRTHSTRHAAIATYVGVVILGTLLCARPATGGESSVLPINQSGIAPSRGYVSLLPWEQIDMFSGNVVLTFDDLVLPGYGGLDLRIQRTFNSNSMDWRFSLGYPETIYDEGPNTRFPVVSSGDGSEHPTFLTSGDWAAGVFTTSQYWRYTRPTRRLALPNGHVCEYQPTTENPALYKLVRVADPFGNELTFQYQTDGRIGTVTQDLGSGQTRTVTFSYAADTTTIAYGSRVWTYRYTDVTIYDSTWRMLTRVSPPEGGEWVFAYLGHPREGVYARTELRVTTPDGGTVSYRFAEVVGPTDPETRHGTTRMVIDERSTDGAAPGLWRFCYQTPLGLWGRMLTPSHTLVRFDHHVQDPSGMGWALTSKSVYALTDPPADLCDPTMALEEAGTLVESLAYHWVALPTVGADDPYWYNLDVRQARPLRVRRVTTSRPGSLDAGAWSRRYGYGDGDDAHALAFVPPGCPTFEACQFQLDFGFPRTLVETGTGLEGQDRTTTLTYSYAFAQGVYLTGRVAQAVTTVPGERYETTRQYDGQGFLLTDTSLGVTTQYARHPDGATDRGQVWRHWFGDRGGLLQPTTYEYAWGAVARTATPEYAITRVVNDDGTVQSETRRGFATTFEWDELGRETRRVPPAGHPLVTTYTAASGGEPGSNTVARGLASTTTTLDAWGRPVATVNSVGVRTRTGYDAEGRVVYRSDPFDAAHAENGTSIQYDALGRPTIETYGDGAFRRFEYSGLDVRVWNEREIKTDLHADAYADPAAARIRSVVDGEDAETLYGYTALGRLTSVTQTITPDDTEPDAPTRTISRTWDYFPGTDLIASVSEPEGGSVSFTYTDAGQVESRRDDVKALEYCYDLAGRLSAVRTLASGPTRCTGALVRGFSWDASDNRVLSFDADSGVTTRVEPDPLNRPLWRTDAWSDPATGSRSFTTWYTYEGDHLATVRYPSGFGVRFVRDAEGRASEIQSRTDPADRYATAITWHPAGGVESWTAANGVTTQVSRDARQRTQALDIAGVLHLGYVYGDRVNVTAITDSRPGMSQTFGYDNVDRLTLATGAWGALEYRYDESGNRVAESRTPAGGATVKTTSAYDAATNRLMSSTVAGATSLYQYTALGQLHDDGAATYTYTPTDLVRTVSQGGALHTYGYDASDGRIISAQGASRLYTLRGAGGEVMTEAMESALGVVFTRDYVYLDGRIVAAATPPPGYPGGPPATPPGPQTPADGTTGLSPVVDLAWSATSGAAAYEYRVTPSTTIDSPGPWQSAASSTSASTPSLATGITYAWQVRAYTRAGDVVGPAAWSTFTVGAPVPPVSKTGPADGATYQPLTLALQWQSSLTNAGYSVCWDTIDNQTCDTSWWPNGAATAKTLAGLFTGTTYLLAGTGGHRERHYVCRSRGVVPLHDAGPGTRHEVDPGPSGDRPVDEPDARMAEHAERRRVLGVLGHLEQRRLRQHLVAHRRRRREERLGPPGWDNLLLAGARGRRGRQRLRGRRRVVGVHGGRQHAARQGHAVPGQHGAAIDGDLALEHRAGQCRVLGLLGHE